MRTSTSPHLISILGHEGFRLFFPLSAIYAALWPVLWIVAFGFDLPLAHKMPPSLWHAHEMVIGAFGAALIGFLTTAAPEWTDTKPLSGQPLFGLAGLWGLGRAIGIFGWDGAGLLGALADCAWLMFLIIYLVHLSVDRRTDRLLAFIFWLVILLTLEAATRWYFFVGNISLASKYSHLTGFAFLGLLGIALARITVPVTNLVLDPSERTSPFRPHPGRLNLAPGLVLVAILGDVAGLNVTVTGYLFIAAGAAFLDRVAESFIGRQIFRTEILLLGGSAAMAGGGLMLIGAARLGAAWPEVAGLHLALMGGLGLGVFAVFCIAGSMHSGLTLGLDKTTRLAAILLTVGIMFRIIPALGVIPSLPSPPYITSSLFWGAGFLLWVFSFWPALSRLENSGS